MNNNNKKYYIYTVHNIISRSTYKMSLRNIQLFVNCLR